MTTPTPPTEVDAEPADVRDRLAGTRRDVPPEVLARITDSGARVLTGDADRAAAGRDWWPIAIEWAARGQVAARPAVVVRPATTAQVAATLAACSAAGVPVTAMGGRSGVCGGSVPVFGGVSLDTTGLQGEIRVDETSLVADVPAGIFGPDLEATLRSRGAGYTLGHWPQSMDLSTVGGWLACRSAGQYSTRYGKIEDMVAGLEVVLADGTVVATEGHGPRAATGPSLTQLFVGSEGTLGVVTAARLRVHPLPPAEDRRAFGFGTFAGGLDACRRILRRGATPAVLRLYDRAESARNFDAGATCVLVVLDEADPGLLAATLAVVDEECGSPTPGGAEPAAAGAEPAAAGAEPAAAGAEPAAAGAEPAAAGAEPATALDPGLVDRWLAHRNDVSALTPLWRAGIVVDTAEVAAPWAALPGLATEVVGALEAVPGTLVASVHQSHAYLDGACLYFTFAGRRPEAGDGGGVGSEGSDGTADDLAWTEAYYRQAWDAVTETVLRGGGTISHHHGIGLQRSRFMHQALGPGLGVLAAVKRALDPAGILNPGKLGLPSPYGEVPWP